MAAMKTSQSHFSMTMFLYFLFDWSKTAGKGGQLENSSNCYNRRESQPKGSSLLQMSVRCTVRFPELCIGIACTSDVLQHSERWCAPRLHAGARDGNALVLFEPCSSVGGEVRVNTSASHDAFVAVVLFCLNAPRRCCLHHHAAIRLLRTSRACRKTTMRHAVRGLMRIRVLRDSLQDHGRPDDLYEAGSGKT